MATLIVQSQLQEMMKRIPEWEADGNAIERTFEFDDFDQTIDFVNEVAEIAAEEEHHPDIDIRFNKVRIGLSTHSEGGVTELDLHMAAKIDNLTE
jgi:4a-hydroxytetrahydrobiopterin dehydratase